uniref:Uncharacterized protein n=1 Tax=Cacopsylla melanoneura TaxID=428564 RepID=A0A8D8LJ37_9HEMI
MAHSMLWDSGEKVRQRVSCLLSLIETNVISLVDPLLEVTVDYCQTVMNEGKERVLKIVDRNNSDTPKMSTNSKHAVYRKQILLGTNQLGNESTEKKNIVTVLFSFFLNQAVRLRRHRFV